MFGADQLGLRFTPSLWRTVAPPRILAEAHYGIYLFPRDAEMYAALGEQAAESRMWAGIHYRSDIDAGRKLAIAVADKVIARAKQDGVQ